MHFKELKEKLSNFPRINLLWGPTPIVKAANLSRETGVEIYLKRDDLTGIALGGNKTRKLEFLLGEALANKNDTVLTAGAIHSNHALQTAAAARKVGINPILVLRGKEEEEVKGNLLLDKLLGADIRIFHVPTSGELMVCMEQIADELRGKGHNPMIIPVGGSNPTGVLGYLNAAVEIMEQCAEANLDFDYVFCSTGSGGTQAGILLGLNLIKPEVKTFGICVGEPKEELAQEVFNLIEKTTGLIGVKEKVYSKEEVYEKTIEVNQLGSYGAVTQEGIDFIKLIAQEEGIYLDPVYTGKGFYGVMNMIKNGEIPKGAKVLFIHTGGLGGVFQYDKVIAGLI